MTPSRKLKLRGLHAAVPLALACAFAVGGCGGQSQDVGSVLRQTFGPHPPIHSYDLGLGIAIDVKGVRSLTKPLSVRVAGPYENAPARQLPRFDLSVSISSGTTFAATATSTADKAYITIGGTPYVLPDALFQQFKNGYAQSSSPAKTPGFSALGLSPGAWLRSPRRVGEVRVGDAKTIHISADVDVPRLLQDVSKLLGRASQVGLGVPNAPKSISPLQQAAIAAAVRSATVDIYTGTDDRVLRRLTVAVSLAVPQAQRALVGGLQSGTISVDYERTRLNKIATIPAPANAHPLSELLGALGGTSAGSALGGIAGSTGASGGAAGSAAGTTPGPATGGASGTGVPATGSGAAPKAYLDCLSAAQGDVAKIQGCAPLLNGR